MAGIELDFPAQVLNHPPQGGHPITSLRTPKTAEQITIGKHAAIRFDQKLKKFPRRRDKWQAHPHR